MPKTLLNEFTFPAEDQDPYFKTISSFYGQLDTAVWNNRLRSNLIIAGGGTLSWNSGTGLLSWTSDFGLKHLSSGFLIEYVYGPDNVNREASILEGQILYGKFASSISESQKRNLFVADSLPAGEDNIVLAWRYSGNLYFQNGIIL